MAAATGRKDIRALIEEQQRELDLLRSACAPDPASPSRSALSMPISTSNKVNEMRHSQESLGSSFRRSYDSFVNSPPPRQHQVDLSSPVSAALSAPPLSALLPPPVPHSTGSVHIPLSRSPSRSPHHLQRSILPHGNHTEQFQRQQQQHLYKTMVRKEEEQAVLVSQLKRELGSTVEALEKTREGLKDAEMERDRHFEARQRLSSELIAVETRCSELQASGRREAARHKEELTKLTCAQGDMKQTVRPVGALEQNLWPQDSLGSEIHSPAASSSNMQGQEVMKRDAALAALKDQLRQKEEELELSKGAVEHLREELNAAIQAREEDQLAAKGLEKRLENCERRCLQLAEKNSGLQAEIMKAEGSEVEARAAARSALTRLQLISSNGAGGDSIKCNSCGAQAQTMSVHATKHRYQEVSWEANATKGVGMEDTNGKVASDALDMLEASSEQALTVGPSGSTPGRSSVSVSKAKAKVKGARVLRGAPVTPVAAGAADDRDRHMQVTVPTAAANSSSSSASLKRMRPGQGGLKSGGSAVKTKGKGSSSKEPGLSSSQRGAGGASSGTPRRVRATAASRKVDGPNATTPSRSRIRHGAACKTPSQSHHSNYRNRSGDITPVVGTRKKGITPGRTRMRTPERTRSTPSASGAGSTATPRQRTTWCP
ncbi:unnamed protein product [Chrysoparadoxa australica]